MSGVSPWSPEGISFLKQDLNKGSAFMYRKNEISQHILSSIITMLHSVCSDHMYFWLKLHQTMLLSM